MEIMEKRKRVNQGVYVIIDPSMPEDTLIPKLTDILQEPIAAVQIWDNFPDRDNTLELIRKISGLCHKKNLPVLINNHWEWLLSGYPDGVHFDSVPENYDLIKKTVKRKFISGLTCGNDLSLVKWANDNGLDYISFCSVFPSGTSNSCELVMPETIIEAKKISSLPVFLAGGILPGNMNKLNSLPYEGVAVISGVMNSETPGMAVREYITGLRQTK
jgi:thiamine-phosphate pyrophosphorylase